jgi:uncharacterized protein (DUF1499 family)
LLFNISFEYENRKVEENREGLELNGTHRLMVYVDDVNLLGKNTNTIKRRTESLLGASREVGLEINTEKTMYDGISKSFRIES